MHYRIQLLPALDAPTPDPESIRAALAETPWLEEAGDEGAHRYESESTGVSFSLRQAHDWIEAEIPLGVPGFYVEEAAPLLFDLSRRLDLRFVVPEDPEPQDLSWEDLAAFWRKANLSVVRAKLRAERGDLPSLPEERLLAWWRHQRGLRDVEDREGLPAAPVEIQLHRRSGEVALSCLWPCFDARLIPEVDLLLVTWRETFEKRRRAGLLRRSRGRVVEKELGGFIPMDAIRPFLVAHAKPVNGPIPLFRYEGGGDARKAAGVIPLMKRDLFQALHPSQVVDLRPQAEGPKPG